MSELVLTEMGAPTARGTSRPQRKYSAKDRVFRFPHCRIGSAGQLVRARRQ